MDFKSDIVGAPKAGLCETLDGAAFRALCDQRLHDAPSAELFDLNADTAVGDNDHNPEGWADVIPPRPVRLAAVLVPIVERANGLHVLFTKRSESMPTHAGQVSFPGGKLEERDASPLDGALREAHEEIGLHPSLVAPVGYLDNYQTVTGFRIVPCVGLVDPAAELTLQEDEVDAVFEVPLVHLMDERQLLLKSREWQGRTRYFYSLEYETWTIWGATAGMLRNMFERITAS